MTTNETRKLIDSLFQELQGKQPAIKFFEFLTLRAAGCATTKDKLAYISSYITELEIEVSLQKEEVHNQCEQVERVKGELKAARKEIADLKASFHRKTAEREASLREKEDRLEKLREQLKRNQGGTAEDCHSASKGDEEKRTQELEAALRNLKRDYLAEFQSRVDNFVNQVSRTCKDWTKETGRQVSEGTVNEPEGKAANKENGRVSPFQQPQEIKQNFLKFKSIGDKEEAK